MEGGKRPFYLKKSEQRRLELLAKYEELQVGGRWGRVGCGLEQSHAFVELRHVCRSWVRP